MQVRWNWIQGLEIRRCTVQDWRRCSRNRSGNKCRSRSDGGMTGSRWWKLRRDVGVTTGTGTGKCYCSRARMEWRRVDLVELVTRTATGDYEKSLTATRSRGQRRTAGDTQSRTTTRSREQRTVDTQSKRRTVDELLRRRRAEEPRVVDSTSSSRRAVDELLTSSRRQSTGDCDCRRNGRGSRLHTHTQNTGGH